MTFTGSVSFNALYAFKGMKLVQRIISINARVTQRGSTSGTDNLITSFCCAKASSLCLQVVNWANPGVIGAREREALESMGMGASLRRTGTAGGARRKYGWEGSGGGVGEGGGFGLQQEGQHHGYKRAR
jgi:hypothetical protein